MGDTDERSVVAVVAGAPNGFATPGDCAAIAVVYCSLHVMKGNSNAIQKWQDDLGKRGLVATTVGRYRTSLSSFLRWCVREGYIARNPVIGTKPPKDRRVRDDMRPLPTPEFVEVRAGDAGA